MLTILLSALYMFSFVKRFRAVFERYGIEPVIPEIHEHIEESDILKHASQFDGAICGDDRYTLTALENGSPHIKVISKSKRSQRPSRSFCPNTRLSIRCFPSPACKPACRIS